MSKSVMFGLSPSWWTWWIRWTWSTWRSWLTDFFLTAILLGEKKKKMTKKKNWPRKKKMTEKTKFTEKKFTFFDLKKLTNLFLNEKVFDRQIFYDRKMLTKKMFDWQHFLTNIFFPPTHFFLNNILFDFFFGWPWIVCCCLKHIFSWTTLFLNFFWVTWNCL